MPLRIEKSWTGDVVALAALVLLPGFQGLRLVGIIVLDAPDWPFYVGSVVCAVCGMPILARWVSSEPLVEMDGDNVTFFTGWTRKERCPIPRTALRLVSVQMRQQEPVLSLLFDAGAVQPLRQFTSTPYLEIKSQEVMIDAGHVRGDPQKVADAWTEALQTRS